MKYGFYVSGNAGRLINTIHQAVEQNGSIDFIDFVLTDNETTSLKHMAELHGFDLYCISYEALGLKGKAQGEFLSDELYRLLVKYETQYCFVFGAKILRGELLNSFENKLINFHPSILPAYKGLSAIDQALSENAFLLGNTAHFVDSGVDTGPVIMQNIIHRSSYEGYGSLLDNQCLMVMQIIKWCNEGRLSVKDGIVKIDKANYSIGNYIPQLEN